MTPTPMPTPRAAGRTRTQRATAGAARRAAPACRVCVLGSGSGGNSTVVQLGQHAMLIDAGFGPVSTAKRLDQLGIKVADLSAICLTHLDQDHFRPTWVRTLIGFGIRVFVHEWHLRYVDALPGAAKLRKAGLVESFDGQAFEPVADVRVSSVRLPHDDKGTSAFRLDSPRGCIGYATDLGHVPDALIDCFTGVDVLMLESNYDPQLQLTSSRPQFLKQRIMGRHGHLSNDQAFDAARRIADRSPQGNPQRVVLLHRSAQCNSAEIVKRTFAQDQRFHNRIVLTQQRRRTQWLAVEPLEAVVRRQLTLGFA